MKFGFVTCVQLGLACMEEIYQIGGRLDLVLTLHDNQARKKSGRVYVDSFCAQHGIEMVKVKSVNDGEAVEAVISRGIDWLFIIGWSQIARASILGAPRRGCLGMHPTLLPQGRGRAAIPWAILKGLDKTGVTLFKLDEGIDTGPILAQEILSIALDETSTTLYQRVATAHRTLIARVWSDLLTETVQLRVQDHSQATEWPERKPEDGEISLQASCEEIERLVRAVTHPYPGAFIDRGRVRYRVWRGVPHADEHHPIDFNTDVNGHLWFNVGDGCYEATEWEAENS